MFSLDPAQTGHVRCRDVLKIRNDYIKSLSLLLTSSYGKSKLGKNGEFTQQHGKTLMCDKRDRAITCMFRRGIYLTSLFSGLSQKDLFKRV